VEFRDVIYCIDVTRFVRCNVLSRRFNLGWNWDIHKRKN